MTPRPNRGRPTLLWLVGPCRAALYRGGGDSTARLMKFAAAAVPSYRPKPKSDLGRTVTTRSSADATSPTRLFVPVAGQCRWRPEGHRHPRRPSPPPDALFSDPEFVAAIIDMTTPSSSASAPPPSTGGSGLTSSSPSHLCTRSRKEPLYLCIHAKNIFPSPICVHKARS